MPTFKLQSIVKIINECVFALFQCMFIAKFAWIKLELYSTQLERRVNICSSLSVSVYKLTECRSAFYHEQRFLVFCWTKKGSLKFISELQFMLFTITINCLDQFIYNVYMHTLCFTSDLSCTACTSKGKNSVISDLKNVECASKVEKLISQCNNKLCRKAE